MFHLFGSAAKPIFYLSLLGLGLACLAATLPTGLLITSVLAEFIKGNGIDWFASIIFDPRNLQSLINSVIVALTVSISLTIISPILALALYWLGLNGDTWI
jgi:ABC-type Fe3+ transport system permease subunit